MSLNVPMAELKKSAAPELCSVSTFQEAGAQAIIEALTAASGRISGRGAAAERLRAEAYNPAEQMRATQYRQSDY